MVAVPWRAFDQRRPVEGPAAVEHDRRWPAPATATPSPPNRVPGTHASTTSGTEAATAPINRGRYGRAGSSSSRGAARHAGRW